MRREHSFWFYAETNQEITAQKFFLPLDTLRLFITFSMALFFKKVFY